MIVEGSVVDLLAAIGAAIVLGVVLVVALVEIHWSRRRRWARRRIAAWRAARARQGEFLGRAAAPRAMQRRRTGAGRWSSSPWGRPAPSSSSGQ